MPVGMNIEIPGMTADVYDQVMTNLDWDGQPLPPGFISHYAGPIDGGWFVFDTWESQQDFENFAQSRLIAAISAAAVGEPPEIHPRFIPIHREAHA
jgi:hypothetical protein